jgi:serine phosphatase RsbU (regulator of sigma subunit)/ABC-type amino acid transport substrate-binding protein
LIFRDSTDNTFKGIYYDLMEHVSIERQWIARYVYEPSLQKSLQNLKDGKIDILLALGYSEERAKDFDFTKETVLTNWGEVFVHKDSKIRTIIDLKGKKVAVMKNNAYYSGPRGLRNLAEHLHINLEYVEVGSFEEVLKAIDQKKAEAGLVSALYGEMYKNKHKIKPTHIVCSDNELRFALRKGNPENPQIIKALDEEMRKLIKDENSVYYHTQNRWLNRTIGGFNYTQLLWGLAIVGAVAAFFLIISFVLRRQVQMRTRELVIKNKEIQGLNEGLERKVQERTAEVVAQKEEIEKINKHMKDSITYARKIQEAMLPEDTRIVQHLPQHFILAMPRDIVSGDFYWFSHNHEKSLSFISVADCTGHGVPGAFMSMLGKSSLDYIMHEQSVETSDIILNELQLAVYRALGKNAKDGMDIAICGFDMANMKLHFAGAQGDLFMIRNQELTVIKGDKAPIGGDTKHYSEERKHKLHTVEMQKGDIFYMTSDGYIDQFGGPENFKFGSKRFRDILLEIHQKDLQAQSDRLRTEHNTWRDKQKQLDDILVIGVRI